MVDIPEPTTRTVTRSMGRSLSESVTIPSTTTRADDKSDRCPCAVHTASNNTHKTHEIPFIFPRTQLLFDLWGRVSILMPFFQSEISRVFPRSTRPHCVNTPQDQTESVHRGMLVARTCQEGGFESYRRYNIRYIVTPVTETNIHTGQTHRASRLWRSNRSRRANITITTIKGDITAARMM